LRVDRSSSLQVGQSPFEHVRERVAHVKEHEQLDAAAVLSYSL
jgi:hypothetical protein